MKVLLDTCVWGDAKAALSDAGHDIVWTGDWEEDPGDEAILAFAAEHERILVTLDKDFGELAVVYGKPHHGILRLVGFRAREQGPACVRILASHGAELTSGALVTAYPDRLRIRPPASSED